MNYKTVYQEATAEIVEKKSRFIADIFPVFSEERAMECLETVKKRHRDARHHCWAYVVGTLSKRERFSDDGEPCGTAGSPILEVIRGQGLCNVLIVITRYFGGTLLGTGGLARAYTAASKEGLAHSRIIAMIQGFKLKIITDYTGLGKIQYVLSQSRAEVLHTVYTEMAEIRILVSEEEGKKLIVQIKEAVGGKIHIERMEDCYLESPDINC